MVDRVDDDLAHLLGEDRELLGVERPQVGRGVDRLEDHEAAVFLAGPRRGDGIRPEGGGGGLGR